MGPPLGCWLSRCCPLPGLSGEDAFNIVGFISGFWPCFRRAQRRLAWKLVCIFRCNSRCCIQWLLPLLWICCLRLESDVLPAHDCIGLTAICVPWHAHEQPQQKSRYLPHTGSLDCCAVQTGCQGCGSYSSTVDQLMACGQHHLLTTNDGCNCILLRSSAGPAPQVGLHPACRFLQEATSLRCH